MFISDTPTDDEGECAAIVVTGIAAIIEVKSKIAVKAVDIIFFIFIFSTSCYYALFPISVKIEIMNVTILATRLENSIAMNIITTIARMVPSVVTKFFLRV